jgi:hypothetical protein
MLQSILDRATQLPKPTAVHRAGRFRYNVVVVLFCKQGLDDAWFSDLQSTYIQTKRNQNTVKQQAS